MARTIIPISLADTTSVSGDPATGDKKQAAIAAAITAASAARLTAHNNEAANSGNATTDIDAIQTAIDAITTAVAAALASQPAIVLDYDASLTRGAVSRALRDHL